MQEETKPAVSRRGLLRRAGTVAAGAGAVGVAAAVAGSPAHAADGQNLVIGQANTGTATTSLTAGSNTAPALKVANAHAAGAALELAPVHLLAGDVSPVVPGSVPLGSTYVDTWGDVHVVGANNDGNGPKFDNMLYSPTWATMPIPISSFRLVDTRGDSSGVYDPTTGFGRTFIVPGSANFDSGSRLLPKGGGPNTPDMVIDLSDWILPNGYAAIQANLAVAAPSANGWLALYTGTFQGTSSINYGPALYAIANFTQTELNENLQIFVKTQDPVIVILDIVGWVVNDPFAQGIVAAGQSAAAALSPGAKAAPQVRRGPGARR